MKIRLLSIISAALLYGCAATAATYSASLLKRAQNGSAQAQNDLGEAYRDGDGVEQDFGKAAEWFAKAAAHNNPDGLFNYGVALIDGAGVAMNCRDGLNYLVQAHNHGNQQALPIINRVCSGTEDDWGGYDCEPFPYKETPDPEVISHAEEKLKGQASTSPSACYYLAMLYENRKDWIKEYKYLQMAHDLFYPDGRTFNDEADNKNPLTGEDADYAIEAYVQDLLGYFHEFGIGNCEKNYAKALEYYETSETRDGFYPSPGPCVPLRRAALCYKKMGDNAQYIKTLEERGYYTNSYVMGGDPWVSLWLAEAYFQGDGVARDYRKAFELFDAITEYEMWGMPMYESFPQIHADACWRIYQMYDQGLGTEQDSQEAKVYFNEAVKYGSSPALARYRKELGLK